MISSFRAPADDTSTARSSAWAFAATALLALGALTTSSAEAQDVLNTTGLRQFGPIDQVNHFPRWYEDTTGLRLRQCTDPGFCFFFPPDPALPAVYPDNWPDEMFYFAANASAAGPALQRLLYVTALECAYAGGPIAAGDEMVFSRTRIRITGLQPLAEYKVTHPYGVKMLTADELGIINDTNDIGLSAGVFGDALHGSVGPFLVPIGFAAAGVPGAFISDGAALETVTGSPFNTNYIRVEGPGVGDAFPDFQHPDAALGADPLATNDVIEVVQFNVQGQVADVMDVDLKRSVLVKTTAKTAVDVWAYSAAGQNIQAAVDGGLFVNLAERGSTGVYYGRVELGLAAPRPTSLLLRNLSDVPATGRVINRPIPDGLMVNLASFTIGGDLVVQATSTDEVSSPILTAYLEGQPVAVLTPSATVPGIHSGPLHIPVGTPPPTEVVVKSSFGGIDSAPVLVLGTGFIGVPTTPILANAGPDINVSPGQRFSLSGAASTGPITSYQWTHNAPATVAFVLENPTSVTPIFTVPNITTPALDILVTLRVTDEFGTPSTDSMIIHVTNPVTARDTVTITDARYLSRTANWRVSGSSSLRQSQVISIYLGPVGNTTRLIGTAIVDGAGAWSFTGANNSAAGNGTIPGNGDSTVWARSALGGESTAVNFRRQ